MLNLHDPMDTVRTRFREVWRLYFNGDPDGAERHMEATVRQHLNEASYQYEFQEIEILQRVLMEEKRRWEDVRQVASLLAEQLGTPAGEVSTVRSPLPVRSDGANAKVERKPVIVSQPSASPRSPSGGLDLAGMIDVMLSDERSSA